jgi:hypothetical protein
MAPGQNASSMHDGTGGTLRRQIACPLVMAPGCDRSLASTQRRSRQINLVALLTLIVGISSPEIDSESVDGPICNSSHCSEFNSKLIFTS